MKLQVTVIDFLITNFKVKQLIIFDISKIVPTVQCCIHYFFREKTYVFFYKSKSKLPFCSSDRY